MTGWTETEYAAARRLIESALAEDLSTAGDVTSQATISATESGQAAIIARKDKRGFPVPFVEWAQEDPVRSFIGERIGYIPDPDLPWDRKWWLDMCQGQTALV